MVLELTKANETKIGIVISPENELLEKTCKKVIETILYCLPDAFKGTIYLVGPLPELRVTRVTSGIRNRIEDGSEEIEWGLPANSSYNYPGKTWWEYRDEPGRPLEAMAWCVERQQSWTAFDPDHDPRSVRKQVEGVPEDTYHMEPVIVPKRDIFGDVMPPESVYPLTSDGKPIWQDTDFVVVAIVKIHFVPGSIQLGDNKTKVIKFLSKTLGTELLSYYLREKALEEKQKLARERLDTCNILAHELRNTLAKGGLVMSVIRNEMEYLREQWEEVFWTSFPDLDKRKAIFDKIEKIIEDLEKTLPKEKRGLIKEIHSSIERFKSLSLLPEKAARWLDSNVSSKIKALSSPDQKRELEELLSCIQELKRLIYLPEDSSLVEKMNSFPKDIRRRWRKLAYTDLNRFSKELLDEFIQFLGNPNLRLPHKDQTRKTLIYLKTMGEVFSEVEEKSNYILNTIKNGKAPKWEPL